MHTQRPGSLLSHSMYNGICGYNDKRNQACVGIRRSGNPRSFSLRPQKRKLCAFIRLFIMRAQPCKTLETFPNPTPERDFHVHMQIPEFTCLCPKTGQPDFATLFLDYIPDRLCVELKSLKLYIWSYRDEGAFHEAVTNRILDDLAAAAAPRFMRLTAKFYVRGGIFTHVVAEHRQPGWHPAPRVTLSDFPIDCSIQD